MSNTINSIFPNNKNLILSIFCFVSIFIHAQDSNSVESITITAKIYDSLNKQPLPLVKVYNLSKGFGTTTSFEGTFRLENLSLKDSITFYSLGYIKKEITTKDLLVLDTVFLSPESQLIDEVVVLADKSILFDLILKCQKSKSTTTIVGKSYLKINSYNEKDQIELIQGYYNGYYNGYDLMELKTKNVRFGLRPKQQRVYTSINISKIFYEHQLFEPNLLFPSNPFQLNSRSLKKNYDLVLNSKFIEGNKTMYLISFDPKNNDDNLFSGKVWIDSAENKIHKIILEIENAARYPFEGFWNYDLLSNVDLKITKSFLHENEITKTNYIDFDYKLKYKIENDTSINITSHATLQTYDYKDSFIEPFIDFSSDREMSRQLSELYIINYDSMFWNCLDEYKSSSDELKNKSFFDDSLTISNYKFLNTQKFINQSAISSFKSHYTNWSERGRIYMKELGSDTTVSRNLQGAIPSEHYNLCAQIYFDINNACDTIYYSTKTIFDPFKTFYHYPITLETIVFINVYFDIVEIQRRKLEENLKTCPQDVNQMKEKYFDLMNETNQLTKNYFNEVNRGLNKSQMVKWNAYVKANLTIDNLTLFMGE